MKTLDQQSTGLSVGVGGLSGAGKTWVGATAPGGLWLLTEANGLGTIQEVCREVAIAESLKDLESELDPAVPLVVPLYMGTDQQRTGALDQFASYIATNAAKLKTLGRSTVILDSLSDANSRIVDMETGQAGDKIEFDAWQRVKMRTLRPLDALRTVVGHGLDLIVTFLVKERVKSVKGEIVHEGWQPLVGGSARDFFSSRLMAVCTLEARSAQKDAKTVETQRTARFVGRTGFHVFKSKGALGIESPNFMTWKAKAFMAPGGTASA